jgi:glucose-1-phosphate adenylyltransferase
VPGVHAYEEPAYRRDVGTLEAYFEAHRDLLGSQPRFDTHNPGWPIQSGSFVGPVARIMDGQISNSMIASGCRVEGGRIANSVLRYGVQVDSGAEVEDCIIMDHVHIQRGARLRRAIVDRYNTIEAHSRVGHDPHEDRGRFHVSPGGIVVIARASTGGVPFSPLFSGKFDPSRPALLQQH